MVLLISAFLLSALTGVSIVRKVSAATAYTEYGVTFGTANCTIRIPSPIESWNRDLVIYCRGYNHQLFADPMARTNAAFSLENDSAAVIASGAAFAATNYGSGGYCVQAGINTTYQLTQYVKSTYNVTGKIYLKGVSMGGQIALLLGEKYPNVYSGVLDVCGAKNITGGYNNSKYISTANDSQITSWLQDAGLPAPPYPFSLYGSSWRSIYRGWCAQVILDMEAEYGGDPTAAPQAYRNADPIYHANISIPVITVHGTKDALVPYSFSLEYQAAVNAAGKSNLHRLYSVIGGEHASADVMAQASSRMIELVAWSKSLTEGTLMWSKTYGGTGYDVGTGETMQTSDGGYAVSGDTNSSGAGGLDFQLFKTDAAGNMIWNKTYGGALDEVSGDTCQTTDGGYAIVGSTTSFGAGGQDFYLVKTDTNGNMLWNKTYGGTSDEWAVSVFQTNDGGYALAGYTRSFGAGDQDFYFVKTDANGNMQWNKTYGGTGTELANRVVQTSEGGYVMAGYTNSFGAGGNDLWLVKTDASGSMLWNKTYGGTGNDVCEYLVQTRDSGYALTGHSTSFGNYKVYLVKTDANGNMQWNKTYGGTGTVEVGIHGIQTSDWGFAIVGWNYSRGQDFLLIKTDAAGDMQWKQTFGGTGVENGYSVVQTSDGGYLLTGLTTSFGAGGTDFYLVKVDASGVVPEGLTIGVIMLLSSIATIVGTFYPRKPPRIAKRN